MTAARADWDRFTRAIGVQINGLADTVSEEHRITLLEVVYRGLVPVHHVFFKARAADETVTCSLGDGAVYTDG